MRALLLLSVSLVLVAACGGASRVEGDVGPDPRVEPDVEGEGDVADVDVAVPDSVADQSGVDGEEVWEEAVEQPACPVEPGKGLAFVYEGPEVDPTTFPDNEAFYALVDDTLAAAAESEPPLVLSREDYPVYDFQVEDSPKGRLTWEYSVRHNHFGLLDYMQGFEAFCQAHPEDPVAQLSFLSDKVDAYVEPAAAEPYLARAAELAAQPGSLACAYGALHEHAGAAAPDAALLEVVPAALHEPLARALYGLLFSRRLFDLATAEARAEIPFDAALYDKATTRTYGALADADGLEQATELVDFRELVLGAQVATGALAELAASGGEWEVIESVRLETPLGAIAIGRNVADVYKAADGPFLLIVDPGGDDHYLGEVGVSTPGFPIAAIIDFAGADRYETSQSQPAFGAGFLGYGLLWDKAGDDLYAGRYDSVASACLGVGVLVDEGGDDSYDSIAGSQASATLGLGLLLDLAGDDHYYAFRASQAYGSYRGGALLLDVTGADLYEAEDDIVLYPAAQNPDVNGNMCQGAGQGFRNDSVEFTETYCGGFALLADLAGEDFYTAAIFAQGVGYWFGIGFLIDSLGDDGYDGVWYNFGAAAHFAGGGHLDSDGNDSYYCLQDQCMGEGRDYSVGFMTNLGGDDEYVADGGRNIGSGDLFGSGVFWDDEGTDSYELGTPWGIGFVFSEVYQEVSLTFGLFLDSGGTEDGYAIEAEHPANETLWTQQGNDNDGEYENVQAIGRDL